MSPARHLHRLKFYGVDISPPLLAMAKYAHLDIGLLAPATALPFPSDYFDIVFAVESLEHSLASNASIADMGRVLRPGGIVIIIDKTVDDPLRRHEIWELEKWERWFGEQELIHALQQHGRIMSVEAKPIVGIDDGLFVAWTGRKK